MSKPGKILKELRIKYNYSQDEVANKIGSTKMTISRYERGERKIGGENLIKLSKLYNVPPEYLLNDQDISITNIIKTKEDLKKDIMAFFKSSDISENDKEEIFNQLQEFYFSEKFEKKK
jgi:transcriptional regulator, cro/CI